MTHEQYCVLADQGVRGVCVCVSVNVCVFATEKCFFFIDTGSTYCTLVQNEFQFTSLFLSLLPFFKPATYEEKHILD